MNQTSRIISAIWILDFDHISAQIAKKHRTCSEKVKITEFSENITRKDPLISETCQAPECLLMVHWPHLHIVIYKFQCLCSLLAFAEKDRKFPIVQTTESLFLLKVAFANIFVSASQPLPNSSKFFHQHK